jgi:DNA polymerase (family 10)
MEKDQIANILEEIGTLLEFQGENPFRCQAYHNAARALRQLEGDLKVLIERRGLHTIPGIGKTLEEKITALTTTGRLPFYEELKAKAPPGLRHFLRLPNLGPKKVKVLVEQLALVDLEGLKAACLEGRVAALKGFGEKTQRKILEGIEFLDRAGRRVRIDQAEALARAVIEELAQAPGIIRMELCGSLRRRKETINDLDILISSDNPAPIMDRFVRLQGVHQVIGRGDTKSSVVLNNDRYGGTPLYLNADLRIVRDDQFPFALHYLTGSKEHNIAMRSRAQERGLKLNEYELAGDGRRIACKDENDLFKVLGIDYIPPELREYTGEIQAGAEHCLPKLIELRDLQGTFHCHSDWSDGAATIEQMALAAKSLGFKYLGIADHSRSLSIARGLTPERVREQHSEIDRLNAELRGIQLFKGTECDILPDGRLDFDDDVLGSFDYVVASVHSHFGQTEEEMTARIVRAVSHPLVTMLGHATGRLLLRRDGYRVNVDSVLQAAAKHGTLIEINSQPHRLDIDWVHCKRARTLCVQMVINPDAHDVDELAFVRYGIDVARRGWLEPTDVFNSQAAAEVTKQLKDKAGRARSRGAPTQESNQFD